jgi:hypothetical protein
MTGADAGVTNASRRQFLLVPNGSLSQVELEAVYENFAIHGGLGTTNDPAGAVSEEHQRVWIHAIAAGPVLRAADSRGQVLTGTLAGYLALAPANEGFEEISEPATRTDHALSLRTR